MIRFWSKVEKTEGCWLWIRHINEGGYGTFRLGGKMRKAHVVAWELERGPVPDGKVLDHLCRVRHCVNPDHLEVVTQVENILRGVGFGAENFRKQTCARGHDLSGDNVVLYEWRGRRERRCLECRKVHIQRKAIRRQRDRETV